jgi:hypothetical protein
MPIRATGPGPAAKVLAPSPLRVLREPSALCAPLEMSLHRLDRKRLHAPGLVDALGWLPGAPLEADLTRPHRLRLRLRAQYGEPTIGSRRAHVDGQGRIVLTGGLRDWLVVHDDAPVLVWAEQYADGRATGVLAVANPGAVESAFVALCAAEDASKSILAPGRLTTVG